MRKLSDRARRRLELAASELSPSFRAYYERQTLINIGVFAAMFILMAGAFVFSATQVRGNAELRDEVAEWKLREAYERGRAEQAVEDNETLLATVAECRAEMKALLQQRNDALEILVQVQRHIEAGAGDDYLRELVNRERLRRLFLSE